MKHLTTLMLALTCACAHVTDRVAVHSLSAVEVADQSWSSYVDTRIAVCKAEPDPSACIEPVAEADDQVAKGISAYVLSLRAYWYARGAGDKAGVIAALRGMAQSINELPDDRFGGVKKLLRSVR